MALVKCGECGQQVSTTAQSCPGCGAPPPSEQDATLGTADTSAAAHETLAATPKQRGMLASIAVGGATVVAGVVGFFVLFGLLFWLVDKGVIDPGSNESRARDVPKDPDAIDAGYVLCATAKGVRMITDCKVEGWGKKVDVRMDTTSREARKICTMMADTMAGKGFGTKGGGWTLRILSPYSGDQPIATCPLR